MQVSRNGRGFLWVRHYVFGGGDFDFRETSLNLDSNRGEKGFGSSG